MLEILSVLASAGRRSVNFPLTSVKTPWEGELDAGHGCGDHGLLVICRDDDTGDGDLLLLSPRYSYRYAEE